MMWITRDDVDYAHEALDYVDHLEHIHMRKIRDG